MYLLAESWEIAVTDTFLFHKVKAYLHCARKTATTFSVFPAFLVVVMPYASLFAFVCLYL
jgi:hypothetical protein